jgi:hypothetical protein
MGVILFLLEVFLVILSGMAIAGSGIGSSLRENTYLMLNGPGLFFMIMGVGSCLSGNVALRNYLVETRDQDVNGGLE